MKYPDGHRTVLAAIRATTARRYSTSFPGKVGNVLTSAPRSPLRYFRMAREATIWAGVTLGSGVKATWERLLKGHSALRRIERFKVDDMPCRIAAMIPFIDEEGLPADVPSEALFNPDDWMHPRERRRVDDFILYGMAAAKEAIADSGWVAESEEDQIRTGVLIGSGVGGLSNIEETFDLCLIPRAANLEAGGVCSCIHLGQIHLVNRLAAPLVTHRLGRAGGTCVD